MFFANLTLLEFLGLFGLLGAATVALYLLNRARKRFQVSTLKFWRDAGEAVERQRRRRIDQPLSLLLQLLAIALLLLAIAQPRIGSPDTSGRDHVLLMDTSAWMTAATPQQGTLAQDAARQALVWLRTVPSQDRVMVVHAGALATPVTAFESEYGRIEQAIRAAAPGAGALDLDQAFTLAVQAQRLEARQAGEIVYVGAGRLAGSDPNQPNPPPNLRVLRVGAAAPVSNIGLTRAWVKRDTAAGGAWQAFFTVKNYGAAPRTAPLTVALGGAVVAARAVSLPAGGETTIPVEIRTRSAGWIEARLTARDAIPADNRVEIEIPEQPLLRVAVFSDEPGLLRPLLAADPRVEASFLPASAVNQPPTDAGLLIFDRCQPAQAPTKPALWIEPEAGASPIPARRAEGEVQLARWTTTHPVGTGLRTRDLRLARPLLLRPGAGDVAIAEGGGGALVAARTAEPRAVVLGFHPGRTALRYELTTPLLMANMLHWLAPDTFLRRELLAGSPGPISFELDEIPGDGALRVLDETGAALPFTVDGRTLRFFAPDPGAVRVLSGGAERTFALTLPALGESTWEAPDSVRQGPGAPRQSTPLPKETWQWLAAAGAALLFLEWWLFGRARTLHPWMRRAAFAVKAVAIVAALVSIVEPAMPVDETKMAVAVLVDTSASISDADLARASEITSSIERASGRHITRVFPFGRALRQPGAEELAAGWRLGRTAGEGGRATSLEAAIREGAATLPSGLVPRLVLITDGRETMGSAARAAYQARQLGIPVDTFVLNGRPEPRLRLESLRLPSVAFTGERFPIELTVESPEAVDAQVEISAEGRVLGANPVSLLPGLNQVRVTAAVGAAGAIDVSGVVRAGRLGELRFEQALSLRTPRLLYLTMDPPELGMEASLLETLAGARFDITTGRALEQIRLDEFQVVVLNNYDFESIPPAGQEAIERYVQRGGGLLVIGGERNIYVERKGQPATPLERTLPAVVAPPRSPEGTSVILIVDKSSSMEGRKMELARVAAIGVVDNLRPIDYIGVLIFDNSHEWAVPLRRAEDQMLIKRLIAGIMPDGGTQIAPALTEAYNRMQRATGAYKHIVLLTDGIAEEGNSMEIATSAAQSKVTISTVGLGQDVNRAYLQKVADLAKGKAYFVINPEELAQILIRDVMEHTGSTTVEKPIQAIVKRQAELFQGLDLARAPELKGYVRFEAKPQADTLLTLVSTPDEEDPLLSRWQYGLGRAAVFTSDAKARWAEGWVGWAGYPKFWTNVVRELLPNAQSGEATLTHDPTQGELLAEYRLAAHVEAPAEPPALYALGPDGYQRTITAERAGDGYYRARVPIGARQGLFRVRPLEESRAFPETGLYLPEPELSTFGNNPQLLAQIAAYTGGQVNPEPRDIFNPGGRTVPASLRLWPGLIGLALLLNFLELAWRKLRRT